ncbi:hypothetical protein [Streptomyces sp. NPDC051569]|uniref:hypothetical protein n=1 Tax=Streptomyces sp. NPDC051569 TaxID=3365661 RepID=UPI00378D44F4
MPDTKKSIKVVNADSGEAYAVIVQHDPITDRRLSLADLGLYVRCLWLHHLTGAQGDVDWMIRELGMHENETRAGLTRLAEAGYIHLPSEDETEAFRAARNASGIRAALQQTGGRLSEGERATVERFAALTEDHARVAAASVFDALCSESDT